MHFFNQNIFIFFLFLQENISQRAHDLNTTSPQRRCNVMTLHRRWGDVAFTSCACRVCCRVLIRVPQRGASNEYPQHIFSYRNNKRNIWYCSYLELRSIQFNVALMMSKFSFWNSGPAPEQYACRNVNRMKIRENEQNKMRYMFHTCNDWRMDRQTSRKKNVNPSLAEHNMPCLSKQCRSRSVKKTDLDLHCLY